MDNADIIDTLNKLIEISKDGEYGFARCAALTQDAELALFFARRAGECAHAVCDLQRMVAHSGGRAEAKGSAGGAWHRGWVAVKGRISADGDGALLDECLRAQEWAAQRYRHALVEPLPALLCIAVEQQYEGLLRNRERVRARCRRSGAGRSALAAPTLPSLS